MVMSNVADYQFDDVLKSLQKLKASHVERYKDWYQSHKKWNRRLHVFSTVGVILLGVTVPVFVMAKAGDGLTLTAALALAALSSLSTAFQWGLRWRQQTYAQLELEDACAEWDFSLIGIKQRRSASEAMAATEKLLFRCRSATQKESVEFFRSVDNASLASFRVLESGIKATRDPS